MNALEGSYSAVTLNKPSLEAVDQQKRTAVLRVTVAPTEMMNNEDSVSSLAENRTIRALLYYINFSIICAKCA